MRKGDPGEEKKVMPDDKRVKDCQFVLATASLKRSSTDAMQQRFEK